MSGFILHSSSEPRPHFRSTRELKFSITISETAISRFTISRPLPLRTFRLRLFLLTLVSLKFPEVFRLTSRFWGVVVLGNLPRSFSGHSIFMISAPKAPSQRVAQGPARTQLKSTTRMFSRARGRDIAAFSGCIGDHAAEAQPAKCRPRTGNGCNGVDRGHCRSSMPPGEKFGLRQDAVQREPLVDVERMPRAAGEQFAALRDPQPAAR